MESEHTSVLMEEVMEALSIASSDVVLDATLGGAGHFKRLLAALGSEGTLIGIDADNEAVERAREALAQDRRPTRPVAHLINDNFRNLAHVLERLNIAHINKALFDLGWSGHQLAAARGFSFQKDEPLMMTYGEGARSAAEIINSATEEELADILYTYGEERFARGIAKSIVSMRRANRLLTTNQLVEAVIAGTPSWYQHRKIHPATKTFQALRIVANDELEALREGLASTLSLLAPGGRIAVISFHSIEDRIVKGALRDAALAGQGSILTRTPITPSRSEVAANRRARSAKLRVFERCTAVKSPSSTSRLATYV